jgi:ABC-2 type transport system ATP-binding protein
VEEKMQIFELNNITARYGKKTALQNVSFSLEEGNTLGLIGQNGAGKSTAIKILLGFLKQKTGNFKIFGNEKITPKLYSQIGFAPEEVLLPEFLNGKDYLTFIASYRIANEEEKKSKVSELLEYFELDPKKKIKEYSKGMNRRLILASSFIGQPKLIILDEPLNGLDPMLVIKLRDKLIELKKAGSSILYSSHLLFEVEKCCSHLVILKDGEIKYQATTEECLKKYTSVEKAFLEHNL